MGLDAKGNPIEINPGNVRNYRRERSVVHYGDTRIKKFVKGSYKLQTAYSSGLSSAAARAASYQRSTNIHSAHASASLSSRGNSPLSPASCYRSGPELHLSRCDWSAFTGEVLTVLGGYRRQ